MRWRGCPSSSRNTSIVRVILADLSHIPCGGGYGDGFCVYIDENSPQEKQDLDLIHEVVENFARDPIATKVNHKVIRIGHPQLDYLAVEILDAQRQLEELRHANET